MNWWLIVGVESGVAWPTSDVTIRFQGHELILRAATEKTAPTIEMQYEDPITAEEAHVIIRRFMSSLSWAEGSYIRETGSVRSGQRVGIGRSQPASILNHHFHVDYLPETSDPKATLALALYREARSLNSIPYQFLGYFKIINILNRTGKEQKNWINSTLPRLTDHRATGRLNELASRYTDIGEYLYESGRCAVAHAFDDPLVDPDKLEDNRRLAADLPVIKALAEHLIEQELGIKSHSTIWREHLYELNGFREILSGSIVSDIKAGNQIEIAKLLQLPPLSIRLRDHSIFKSLENLAPEIVDVREGRLIVICSSSTTSLTVNLCLNFADERLELDPVQDIVLQDDGSAEIVEAAVDHLQFVHGLIRNGQLEVWASGSNTLLGRCDPCVPVNIDPQRTEENIRRMLSELEAELVRRREGPS